MEVKIVRHFSDRMRRMFQPETVKHIFLVLTGYHAETAPTSKVVRCTQSEGERLQLRAKVLELKSAAEAAVNAVGKTSEVPSPSKQS